MASNTVEFLLRFLGVKEGAESLERVGKEARQAAEDFQRIEPTVQGAGRRLQETGQAATKSSASLKDLGDRAGNTESVIMGLAGALDLVAPGLGNVARAAGDVAGGAEAITKAGTGLAPVLAGIAAVAGTVYLAWKNLNEAQYRSEQLTRIVREQNEKLKPVLEQTAAALIDLREANGELSEEEAARLRASVAGYKAFQDATEDARKKMAALREEQGSVTTQMVSFVESHAKASPKLWLLGQAMAGVTTNADEYQQQIDALGGTIETAADAVRTMVDTQHELGSTLIANQPALKEHTAEVEEAAKAWAELTRQQAYSQALGTPFKTSFSGGTFDSTITDPTRLQSLRAQVSGSLGLFGERLGLEAGAGKSALGALAGGDLGGALGPLGPLGAAAGGLMALGEGGAEGIVSSLEDQADNLLAGIVELPELIFQRLPEFIVKLTVGLAKTLIIELPKAILQAFVDLWERIREFFRDLFTLGDRDKSDSAISRSSAARGARLAGGMIEKTGLYLMHQGELAVPATGVASSSGQRQLSRALTGGGGITVVNQGVMTPSLVREITETVRRGQSAYGAALTLDPAV